MSIEPFKIINADGSTNQAEYERCIKFLNDYKDGKIPVTSTRRTNVLFRTSLVIFVLFLIGAVIPWESLISKFTVFSNRTVGCKTHCCRILNYLFVQNRKGARHSGTYRTCMSIGSSAESG